MDFFNTAPEMRGYQGDTFPEFVVRVDLDSTDGYTMRMVLENAAVPGSVALVKSCTAFSDAAGVGFTVQLVSTETAALTAGAYTLHFILTDADSLEYRRLVGSLRVLASPREVQS